MSKTTETFRYFSYSEFSHRFSHKLSHNKKLSYKPMGYFMLACSLAMTSLGYADPKSYTFKIDVYIPGQTMKWIQLNEEMAEQPNTLLLTPIKNSLFNLGKDLAIELKEKTDTDSNDGSIVYTGQVMTHEITPYDTSSQRPDHNGDYDNNGTLLDSAAPTGSAVPNKEKESLSERLLTLAKMIRENTPDIVLALFGGKLLPAQQDEADEEAVKEADESVKTADADAGADTKKLQNKGKKNRKSPRAAEPEPTTSPEANAGANDDAQDSSSRYFLDPEAELTKLELDQLGKTVTETVGPLILYSCISKELKLIGDKIDSFEGIYYKHRKRSSRSKPYSSNAFPCSEFTLSFRNQCDEYNSEVTISNKTIGIKYNHPEMEGEGFFSTFSPDKFEEGEAPYLGLKHSAYPDQDGTVTISVVVQLTKPLSKNKKTHQKEQQAGQQEAAMQTEPEITATIDTGEENRSEKTQQTTATASTMPAITMTQAGESAPWRPWIGGATVFPPYMHHPTFASQVTSSSMQIPLPLPHPQMSHPYPLHMHHMNMNMKRKGSPPTGGSSGKRPKFKIKNQ